MIHFCEAQIASNLPLSKFCSDADIICFEKIIDNFLPIARQVCGILNSKNNSGTIIVGVNKSNFCVGCISERDKWESIMLKLSKFLYATIVDVNNVKFNYEIEMYEMVQSKKPRFMSKINVCGKKEDYFVNNNGNISSYKREDCSTINVPLTEEMILKINDISEMKIGEHYGEESDKMEFKLSFNALFISKDGIEKYISSFGNSGGGKLVIGVNDSGRIEGVKVEDNEWDKIQRDILAKQHSVSSVEFLKRIDVRRKILNKRNYFLVEIEIPASEGQSILVKDKNGCWNKWVRVLSCSVKDDRQILYTQKEYQEMENKYAIAEAMRKKVERDNENMRKSISALEKRNNDVIINIQQTKEIQEKYNQNILKKFMENYYQKCNNYQYFDLPLTSIICTLCFFSGYLIR